MEILLNGQKMQIADEMKSVAEIFKNEITKDEKVIACDVNNEIKSLDYIPTENDKIQCLPAHPDSRI